MKRTYRFHTIWHKIVLVAWLFLFTNTLYAGANNTWEPGSSENVIKEQAENLFSGKIYSPDGNSVSDVNVSVKGTDIATRSDDEGRFSLRPEVEDPVLVFEKELYESKEIDVAETAQFGPDNADITLKPEEDVYLLWDSKQKEQVTSSVSTVSGDYLKNISGTNRNNVLGGRVSGLTVMQNNGLPGVENSSLYVRGLNSLSSNSALMVVDGYVRPNASYINPNNIESVSVLKDAGATAMYGMRGGAGVVQITTKRGWNQPLEINFDSQYGFEEPMRLPKYLGSHDYAYLYNEASRNDGGSNVYSSDELDAFASGDDPYNYPNVNWQDEFLRSYTSTQKYNLSARGGSDIIRYFASLGYTGNDGIYHVDDDANAYNTNRTFDIYDLRTNVDLQITDKVSVRLDVGLQQREFNYPGNSSGSDYRILSSLYETPPLAHPVFNEDGSLSGTTQYDANPYGLLNNSGYSQATTRATDAVFSMKHDDAFVEGLSAYATLGFDSYFTHDIRRHKGFYVYEGSESTENERGDNSPATQVNQSNFSDNQRVLDLQIGVDFNRSFGRNDFDGKLFINENTHSVDGSRLNHVYRGLIGRLNYVHNDRYLADVTFAYQGSEQTGNNNRYILYPALSLGWILSEEDFLSESNTINFLKIRASHGLTGNDRDIGYFQKFSFFTREGGYIFGTGLSSRGGYREGVLGTPNIRPEQTRKSNLGVDAGLFGNRVSFSGDVFFEKTTDIITALEDVPALIGARVETTGNAGIVENKGFEVSLGYSNHEKAFGYSINGNFTYARNEIIDMQEREYPYSHNVRTGQPVGSFYGLEAIGFFYDDDDVVNSPDQSIFGPYGPGDIKYRDITGDGVVDEDDISKIGNSWMPEMVYGIDIGLSYKGIDFKTLIQGVGNVDRYLNNYAYYDFYPESEGNLMEHHLDRWAYYPDQGIDTRDEAQYPRLSLSGFDTNSKQNSSFWLSDASYIRIKTIELGYRLPDRIISPLHLQQIRLYTTVYNAFTFDKVDVVDPEMGNGVAYPIQRMMNFGINVKL